MRRTLAGFRRASTLVASLLALFLLNLAVMNAVTASGDDTRLGALRLATARAFYAAESGAAACVRQMSIDADAPLTGTYTLPGGESVEIVDPIDAQSGGSLVVEGRYGPSKRRIEGEAQ